MMDAQQYKSMNETICKLKCPTKRKVLKDTAFLVDIAFINTETQQIFENHWKRINFIEYNLWVIITISSFKMISFQGKLLTRSRWKK